MMDKRLRIVVTSVLAVLLAGLLSLRIASTRFPTSVVELLPGESTGVEVLRDLAEKDQGRILTVRLHVEEGRVRDAAWQAFQETLTASPAILEAWPAGAGALKEAGRILFANRYPWLLPGWLDRNVPEWRRDDSLTGEAVAGRVVDQLDAYLQSPDSFALVETIPQDPFLLLTDLQESGLLPANPAGQGERLLWVRQAASPFSPEGQEPVFEALASALETARLAQADLRMEYTGVSEFAEASKDRIKAEIQRMNILGILLVIAISIMALRDWRVVLRIASVVLLSLLTAATVVITLYPEVHIIALVIGSILAGIAVDYAFHLILVERSGLERRAITKAVVAGSLSSALGFLVLVMAPLPFLRQVGVFVGSGLLAALFFSLLLRPGQPTVGLSRKWRILPFSLPRWSGPVLLLIGLPGLFTLQWRDSIADLEVPLPALKEKAVRLNDRASLTAEREAFLVTGASLADARRQLEELEAAAESTGLIHAGRWIAEPGKATAAQGLFRRLSSFPQALAAELENRGFVSEQFSPFFSAWETYLSRDLDEDWYSGELRQLAQALPGPLGNLVHRGGKVSWFMVLAPRGTALPDLPAVVRLDQGHLLSRSFAEYREAALSVAGWCLLAIMGGILVLYGLRGGLGALAIPALAIPITYGITGYIHGGLGLFHVVGGLLAFCISLDYALFAVQAHRRALRLPASVTVSALTTLGVFSILTTSRIPGVHQLGLTVLMGLSVAALLILAGWPLLRRTGGGRPAFRLIPHGEEALMLDSVLSTGDRFIEAEACPARWQAMPSETLVEAMAQAAAAWLASTGKAGDREPAGLLVVVRDCRLEHPLAEAGSRFRLRVESMTEAREGLLVFKGKAVDAEGALVAECTFSIFIPPTAG